MISPFAALHRQTFAPDERTRVLQTYSAQARLYRDWAPRAEAREQQFAQANLTADQSKRWLAAMKKISAQRIRDHEALAKSERK